MAAGIRAVAAGMKLGGIAMGRGGSRDERERNGDGGEVAAGMKGR